MVRSSIIRSSLVELYQELHIRRQHKAFRRFLSVAPEGSGAERQRFGNTWEDRKCGVLILHGVWAQHSVNLMLRYPCGDTAKAALFPKSVISSYSNSTLLDNLVRLHACLQSRAPNSGEKA